MKVHFSHFKRLLLESILDEDKSRLIDKLVLPDLDSEEDKVKAKEEMKSFFKIYSNFENKLDWNKLADIKYSDFEKVKELAKQTKGAKKREIGGDAKNIFKSVEGRKFEIVGENTYWLFVAPLTHEAAVFCDSSENQGGSAKWCIGYGADTQYWDDYTKNGSLFIMAFNKSYKNLTSVELQDELKYMIQRSAPYSYKIWNQKDETENDIDGFLYTFGINVEKLESMFEVVSKKIKQAEKEAELEAKQSLKQKIDEMKNLGDSIESGYFSNYQQRLITDLVIPDNITCIGNDAFMNFKNLVNVQLPKSLTKIGQNAFAECTALVSIKFPNTLKSIERCAFYNCSELHELVIPDSVTSIGNCAFEYCNNIESLKIGKNVQTIGDAAFDWCLSIESIELPEGLLSIGQNAFSRMFNLKTVTIPSTILYIGRDAFMSSSGHRTSLLSTVLFKGKTIDEVKKMMSFPFGISNYEKIIQVEK